MKRILCAALALAFGAAACGSDGTLEPAGNEAPASPGLPAAEASTTYAVGGPSDVPWSDAVTYRIRGEKVARFDAESADRRKTWDGCPKGTATYEGRDCPVSPLNTLALLLEDGGEVVYEAAAPKTVGCNRYRPAAVEAEATVWIRPPRELRDCFSDFSVALSLDTSGRIVAVDFLLSGP